MHQNNIGHLSEDELEKIECRKHLIQGVMNPFDGDARAKAAAAAEALQQMIIDKRIEDIQLPRGWTDQ